MNKTEKEVKTKQKKITKWRERGGQGKRKEPVSLEGEVRMDATRKVVQEEGRTPVTARTREGKETGEKKVKREKKEDQRRGGRSTRIEGSKKKKVERSRILGSDDY